MSTKVKVIFGVFGGDRMATRLRKTITDAGYTLVNSVEEADVVIAHSAGCFWLPPAPAHQKFILIGPPYWPGKSVRTRMRDRGRSNLRPWIHDYTLRYWLARNAWGVYYAFADFKRNIRIIQHARSYDLTKVIKGHSGILVRNAHDDWLTPDLQPLLRANPGFKLVELPGDHDDIAHHPEAYVNLIQSLL